MAALGLVLFVGAIIGHTAILVKSVNWWYSHAIPHRILGGVRFLHGLLVLAGIYAFGRVFGLDLSSLREPKGLPAWQQALALYLTACAAVGLVYLPALTAARLLRRPRVLAANHTVTVDVARALGYRPIGWGKHRHMARVPFNDLFRVDFAEKTLRLPRLPAAWDGLSVLHVSDLHMCGTPDRAFYQFLAERCRDWDPDIVAVTGDTVDSDIHHRWVLPVLGRLRWRVAAFAIFGNHESWFDPALVRRRLRRCGFDVVGNGWRRVEIRGEPLVVVGNETPWFCPAPDLRDCPTGPFRLCLSHTPDNLPWAKTHGVDLMLSGHCHGGQVRVPGLGSILVPSRYGRRYDAGTFEEAGTVLHVCRGVGGQHPLRINCRPEVAKLVLRPGPMHSTQPRHR